MISKEDAILNILNNIEVYDTLKMAMYSNDSTRKIVDNRDNIIGIYVEGTMLNRLKLIVVNSLLRLTCKTDYEKIDVYTTDRLINIRDQGFLVADLWVEEQGFIKNKEEKNNE